MNDKQHCGIIGFPLNNPRSIPIWKKYFKKNKINSSMKGFEVHPKKIKKFVVDLKKNNQFKAAAITMPFKKKLFKHIIPADSFSKLSRSVNLVKKKNNYLYGYNTDIYGAMETIKREIRLYKKIIIFGLGGSGSAIFNYLKKKYKRSFIIITTKNIKNKNNIIYKKKIDKETLQNPCLIINCTPLGSNLKKKYKYKSIIDLKAFKFINKKSYIFDIVYKPKMTQLARYCKKFKIGYKNGLKMNTIQAEKALKIVFGR